MEGQLCKVLNDLHVSPETGPSKGTKLCTNFAWFLLPGQLRALPYQYFPVPIFRLQLLMHFRMGFHALTVEQCRPAIPQHLRRCTLCGIQALGDERHFVFDCPQLIARKIYEQRMLNPIY